MPPAKLFGVSVLAHTLILIFGLCNLCGLCRLHAEETVVGPPVGLIVGTRISLERERVLAQAANGYDTPLATTPK